MEFSFNASFRPRDGTVKSAIKLGQIAVLENAADQSYCIGEGRWVLPLAIRFTGKHIFNCLALQRVSEVALLSLAQPWLLTFRGRLMAASLPNIPLLFNRGNITPHPCYKSLRTTFTGHFRVCRSRNSIEMALPGEEQIIHRDPALLYVVLTICASMSQLTLFKPLDLASHHDCYDPDRCPAALCNGTTSYSSQATCHPGRLS